MPIENNYHSDTIREESENEEDTNDEGTNEDVRGNQKGSNHQYKPEHLAAASLRQRQTVALAACFIFPVIMTWVLHHLRASLSRPAEGLISNTNLTIFLFAAEFRPCHEVGKMFQARTIWLQKSVATSSKAKGLGSADAIEDLPSLFKRVTDVEEHIVASQSNGAASGKSETEIITAVRKSIQPELDALNRAVRRYEKRATVQAMDTDSRLQGLEARMSDAITLAAAAERSVIQARESNRLVSLIYGLLSWPITLASSIMAIPLQLLTLPYDAAMGYLRPKIEREKRTAGLANRRGSRRGSEDDRRKGTSRGLKKVM